MTKIIGGDGVSKRKMINTFLRTVDWGTIFKWRNIGVKERNGEMKEEFLTYAYNNHLGYGSVNNNLMKLLLEGWTLRFRWKMYSNKSRVGYMMREKKLISARVVRRLMMTLIKRYQKFDIDGNIIKGKLMKEWRKRVRSKGLIDRHCYGHVRTIMNQLRQMKKSNYHQNSIPSENDRSKIGAVESVKINTGIEKKNTLVIASHNVVSLNKNVIELFDILDDNVDIVGVQETRIRKDERLNLPEGWMLINEPRVAKIRGGGVGFLVRKSLGISEMELMRNGGDGECMEWVWIKVGKSNPIFIASVYQPPNRKSKNDEFLMQLEELQGIGRVIVCGDLNVDYLKKKPAMRYKYWTGLMHKCRLSCINETYGSKPTHFQGESETLLDYMLVDERIMVCDFHRIPTAWDHFGVKCVIELHNCDVKIVEDGNRKRIAYHRLNKMEYQHRFCVEMEGMLNDDDDSLSLVEKINKAAVNSVGYCTTKTKSGYKHLPYWNQYLNEIIRSKRRIRKMISRAVKLRLWQRWRNLKPSANVLTSHFRAELWKLKNEYYRQLKCMVAKQNHVPHYVFQWMKSIGDGNKKKTYPFTVEEMNSEWRNIISSHSLIDESKDWNFVNGVIDGWEENDSMRYEEVNENEMMKVILNLPGRKAPGLDEIGYEVFKVLMNSPAFRKELVLIFNNILASGDVPKVWKEGSVVLIPKGEGIPSSPLSYRPIALLPSVAKILECIVWNRLK